MKNDFNPSYIGERPDIVKLVPANATRVLDVGCSVGKLGESIKKGLSTNVTGIEINSEMAEVAKERLDYVIVADVDEINMLDYFSPHSFDCIIFADVLEHLKNGHRVLAKSVELLKDEGIIIASIPNVRHYSTIFNLLFRGIWPHRERGIHDKTHLRFFTLKSIKDMFSNATLEIINIKRTYRIIERPHKYNKFSQYFVCIFPKELLTFQYLILAKKRKNTES